MNYNPHQGYSPNLRLYSAQLKETAKKQMKRSKTSERKKTRMSSIFHLFFLCLILSIISCSEKSDLNFKDSSDALQRYSDFHHSIAAVPRAEAEKLADYICQWQELSDTVYNYIKKDPSFTAHASLSMSFQITSDSVRMELIRLTTNCTLSDVAYVKIHTSPYRDDVKLDDTKKKAAAFYSKLDKQPIYNTGNVREKIANYRSFLAKAHEGGVDNHEELLAFIKAEDRHFRTFLANIGDYTDVGLGDITKLTELICTDIFRSASCDSARVKDVMVYMGMRTCRRLILNAQVCANLLKTGKVNSATQANAYLWMLLQPFLSMDSMTISMLTQEQQQQMSELAAVYPKIIKQLIGKGYIQPEQVEQIPTMIMRLYISTL